MTVRAFVSTPQLARPTITRYHLAAVTIPFFKIWPAYCICSVIRALFDVVFSFFDGTGKKTLLSPFLISNMYRLVSAAGKKTCKD